MLGFFSSSFGLGLEDGRSPTFSLLLHFVRGVIT